MPALLQLFIAYTVLRWYQGRFSSHHHCGGCAGVGDEGAYAADFPSSAQDDDRTYVYKPYNNIIIIYSVIGLVLFVSLRLHKHLHYSNFNGIDVEVVYIPNLSRIYYLLYYNIYCVGNTRFAFLFLIRPFVKYHVLDPVRFLFQNTYNVT